jgi:putative hydrolase of the HAD superfamily
VSEHVDVIFLDVGGVLYSDVPYQRSLMLGLREMGARFTDEEYADAYRECRREQRGSFRRRLARRFLGSDERAPELTARAAPHWRYQPDALFPDVRDSVSALRARYRLGLIANQLGAVREALDRDGLAAAFDIWAISEELGVEKPDPRIYERAIELAEVPPHRAVMCGDRLDYDVEPARRAGMKTVWVLRGEAPDDPTPQQLEVPDGSVRSLEDLPAVIEELR